MTDFLLELRSEEIPARMQAKARDDLARLFAAELADKGIEVLRLTTFSTPRRLALIARGLPEATEAVGEEIKGPKTGAPPQALEGFLRKTGLSREQLTERDGVFFAITHKPGRATAAVLAEAIPAIIRACPWPKSMRWGDASTSTDSLRWVRPLHGIVALFGENIVPVEIAGITSGAATLGHRFHHPGPITIGSSHDYVEKLRACHVHVDQDARAAIIRDGAQALAAAAGLVLVEDEGLVAENAGLTEWPVPLLGRFDEDFLSVPPEVIQLTARVNQKYFVCTSPSRVREGQGEGVSNAGYEDVTSPPPAPPACGRGALANAFICTANIAAPDGGAKIVDGNRKVLAARLSDARFFYEQDLKVPLEEQATKLDRIVFHEKLGTVADKVDRVAKLARWLVEEGIVGASSPSAGTTSLPGEGRGPVAPDPVGEGSTSQPAPAQLGPGLRRGSDEGRVALATLAERAARLCKADLVTGMVGEFPELQGIMGGYYALAQGEDPRVAEAIRDHYKPVGQGDEVPTAPVTVAVSLADKLDSLLSFFAARMPPTGSRDPFALRRAALQVIQIVTASSLRIPLQKLINHAWWPIVKQLGTGKRERRTTELGFRYGVDETTAETIIRMDHNLSKERIGAAVDFDVAGTILDFFADRLKVQQREAGVRHDLIDAVFALGGEDDLVRLLARVRALQSFMATEDGANLLTGYRRAANILKKEGWADAPLPLAGGAGGGQSASPDDQRIAESDSPPPTPPASGRGEEGLSYTPEPAESALIAALDAAEPRATQAVADEAFEGAMAALASLRAPIDRFFDEVTVNDDNADKRAARLALLARVRDAVRAVADFSRIEG